MKPFSELTGSEKTIEVLRWICVPVAPFLAVTILGLILRAAIPPLPAQLPGTPAQATSDVQRASLHRAFLAITAATIVLVGAKTAPRFRRATAIVLSVTWVLLAFLSHVAVHLGRGRPNYADFVIVAVATACAAGYIMHLEKRRLRTDLD